LKILHIITGLNLGGAERNLFNICVTDSVNTHIVISLSDGGFYLDLLRRAQIPVYSFNLKSYLNFFPSIFKLYRCITFHNPDLVQTWMYHADLIGGLIAKFSRVKNIYWNVRHSTFKFGQSKNSILLVSKLCAFFSTWVPSRIIYCAYNAQLVHENFGYDKNKSIVIVNGLDLELFNFDDNLRRKIRNDFSISEDVVLLGMIGRFDPQKDHSNLLSALALVKHYNFILFLIGSHLDSSNSKLVKLIESHGLLEYVHLLGQRADIPELLNALDIHILSSSFGEGFPNVLAEAMACKTPCVATDVGDANLIVGDTGWVVPPMDSSSLANAIKIAIDEKLSNQDAWNERLTCCRHRIVQHFSLNRMLQNYLDIWKC